MLFSKLHSLFSQGQKILQQLDSLKISICQELVELRSCVDSMARRLEGIEAKLLEMEADRKSEFNMKFEELLDAVFNQWNDLLGNQSAGVRWPYTRDCSGSSFDSISDAAAPSLNILPTLCPDSNIACAAPHQR